MWTYPVDMSTNLQRIAKETKDGAGKGRHNIETLKSSSEKLKRLIEEIDRLIGV